MKVVAIALVLLQASLHSCRTYNTATPKNDIETSKPAKLPSKLIQILESLDSSDAKITKIKQLIPVYDDFPEFRVKSNKKHLFMPYKKKGKPLAYILKKTYVNEIVSEHTDESSYSFEDVTSNERIYKGKPKTYRNEVYYHSSQNEKKPEHYGDGDVKNEPEVNDYDLHKKNNPEIKKSAEVPDDLKESIIVLPAEHKHVHHKHRHNIENSEDEAEVVLNLEKVSAVDSVTEAEHKESNHHHHGNNPEALQLFQSEVKSDDTHSNREQIPQYEKVTEDKPIDSITKTDKIVNELDQIQPIDVHKYHHHHHHLEPDISIAAVANNDDNHTLNVVTTKHGHHKTNLDEENVNPKNYLLHHIVAHHTEDPRDLVAIDADELHSDKTDADSDSKHNHNQSNLELVVDTNAIEQKSGKKEHPHSHSHSTHHHSFPKESVKDLDKYLSYLNALDLVSPKTNKANDLNLSNDTVIDATLNDTSPVSNENNDNDAADYNRILHGRTKLMNYEAALSDRRLDSPSSDFSASEYYSDEFSSGKSGDASDSSEPSSEFIDSVSDSNQESTETDENYLNSDQFQLTLTASSESENTSVYSNELVTNDSEESNSAFNSKSFEFDLVLSSSHSESSPESNESGISGLEELPSEASNLISGSVELSSESDSTNLSDETYSPQVNDNIGSLESQSSELSNSGSMGLSEIGSNFISGSDNSDSASENDSKSDVTSSSEYLSQSESESSQIDSAGSDVSESKESIIESRENQLNSTVILAPTIFNKSNSLVSEESYSSLDGNATSSEAGVSRLEPIPSNLKTVFKLGSYPSNVESNTSSIENSALLDTTPSYSTATEGSTDTNLVNKLEPSPSNLDAVLRLESYSSNVASNTSSIKNSALLETTALNSSSTATKESADTNLVNTSIFETLVSEESIASSLMSSASSLKSVASNLESFAHTLESVSGLVSIASKLNTTASELMYVALNLETTAMSLKWGSGLSAASNSIASTESIVRSGLPTESSASYSESKTSNLESLPSFESTTQIIEILPSPPELKAFYSTIQSSINNNVHKAVKKDLCKEKPVVKNILSNGEKTYSMSFVFYK